MRSILSLQPSDDYDSKPQFSVANFCEARFGGYGACEVINCIIKILATTTSAATTTSTSSTTTMGY